VGVKEMSSTAVEIVASMYRALQERRYDDAAAYCDAAIEWEPVVRPARSLYVGLDAVLVFAKEVAESLSPYHLDATYIEQADGSVLVDGVVIRETPGGDLPAYTVRSIVTLRDGLIVRVDALLNAD
jgi:hypothetical protein